MIAWQVVVLIKYFFATASDIPYSKKYLMPPTTYEHIYPFYHCHGAESENKTDVQFLEPDS